MAITHKLRYSSTDINLADVDAIHVLGGYVPAVAPITGDGQIPEYVIETLPVGIKATSEDDLATDLQGLHYAQKLAAEYWVDPQQTTPVWYWQQQDNETGARRALVRSIDFQPAGSWFTPPDSYEELEGTITIVRHPYWERTMPRTMPHTTPTAAAAISYDYTAAGTEKLSNEGFEIAGGGGADIWSSWAEVASDGALANEAVIVHGGADAAKVTAGASVDTAVYQDIAVAAGANHTLTFWSYGDGTYDGRYNVYDVTNSTNISGMTSTGQTAAAWAQESYAFTTPATCISVRILLYCPGADTGVAYFDDASLTQNSHDIAGDVGARIAPLTIVSPQVTSLWTVWMGLRSANRHGATGLTAFEPVWECEAGDTIAADVSIDDTTDPNGASPGSGSGEFWLVTKVGTNWDEAYFQDVGDINTLDVGYTTHSDAYGSFLILLRAKVVGGEWEVRLQYGYSGSEITLRPVVIDVSTGWKFHEMGSITIPPRDLQVITTGMVDARQDGTASITIQARRTSGADNLYLDCLCPIPVDEGYCKVDGFTADTAKMLVLSIGPQDNVTAVSGPYYPGYLTLNPDIEAAGFYLPPGDGRLIAAYSRDAANNYSDIDDQIEFGDTDDAGSSTYFERWVTLRGAE